MHWLCSLTLCRYLSLSSPEACSLHGLIQLCGGYCCSNLFLITLKNKSLFLPTRCTEEVTRQLMQTAAHRSERDGILATRLCTHKDDVEITNERRLQQLPGELRGGNCWLWGWALRGCNGGTGLSGGASVLSCIAAPVQALCIGVEVSGEKLHGFLFKNPQCHYLVCNRQQAQGRVGNLLPPHPCFFIL